MIYRPARRYHSKPKNTMRISMVLYEVCTLEKMKGKRKNSTQRGNRKNGENKKKGHAARVKAESRGQGCCLLVRSVLLHGELMDQYKDVTRRRPDGKQEDKGKELTKNKQSSYAQLMGQDDTTDNRHKEDKDRRTKGGLKKIKPQQNWKQKETYLRVTQI